MIERLATFLVTNEAFIRLCVFAGALTLMLVWEALLPTRRLHVSRRIRWFNNLALAVFNALLLRVLLPLALVGVALLAASEGWGLLNQLSLAAGPVGLLGVLFVVLTLDLAVYVQHVLFHRWPWLWRLHRVHHADLDFDVTTGVRFHPLEIVVSMAYKALLIILLGAPAVAVVIFELLLSATSLFNHGNVSLPPRLEKMARLILVTPDMHRVHHSQVPVETSSNFGFSLPWWDRLFGTYRAQPGSGHRHMLLGVGQFAAPEDTYLHRLLLQPFRGDADEYPSAGRDAE